MVIEDAMAIAFDIARSYGLADGSKRAVLSLAAELMNRGVADTDIRRMLDDFLNDVLRYEFGEEDD